MGRPTSTPSPLTVSARLALLVLMAAEERGVRRSEILAATRTSTEQFMEEDARISLSEEQAIWREAIDRTGDPFLGVDVMRGAPAGFLGFPELLFGSANTLGEALDVACRYMPLVREGVEVRRERDREHVRLVWSASPSGGASRIDDGAEAFLLAAVAVMGKHCAGRRPPIERLSFSSKAPRKRSELARLVDVFATAHIEFGASEPSIILHTSALGWPSLASAPRLHRILKGHADALLLERPGQRRFLSRARQHLLIELEAGRATLAGLARRLAIGERSLQRRLASEGGAFADLLEDLRRELAPTYLRDSDMGLSEIAFRLGYRSPQSFSRAFQGWTGKSPGRWRRELGDFAGTSTFRGSELVAERPLKGDEARVFHPPPSPLERATRVLSPRQAQTLEHLCAGMSEKEIALALGISRSTVHTYVKAIYRVLGVSTRSELLVRCLSTA